MVTHFGSGFFTGNLDGEMGITKNQAGNVLSSGADVNLFGGVGHSDSLYSRFDQQAFFFLILFPYFIFERYKSAV